MTELEIYPDVIWLRESSPDESPQAWLLDCFTDVQRFVAEAADAREAVVIDVG
jgi:Domain of unknown function (DUF1877)